MSLGFSNGPATIFNFPETFSPAGSPEAGHDSNFWDGFLRAKTQQRKLKIDMVSNGQIIAHLGSLIQRQAATSEKSQYVTEFFKSMSDERIEELIKELGHQENDSIAVKTLFFINDKDLASQCLKIYHNITKKPYHELLKSFVDLIPSQNADKSSAFEVLLEKVIPDPKRKPEKYQKCLEHIQKEYSLHATVCILWSAKRRFMDDLFKNMKNEHPSEKATLIVETSNKDSSISHKVSTAERLMLAMDVKSIEALFEVFKTEYTNKLPYMLAALPLPHFDVHVRNAKKISELWREAFLIKWDPQEDLSPLAKEFKKGSRSSFLLESFPIPVEKDAYTVMEIHNRTFLHLNEGTLSEEDKKLIQSIPPLFIAMAKEERDYKAWVDYCSKHQCFTEAQKIAIGVTT